MFSAPGCAIFLSKHYGLGYEFNVAQNVGLRVGQTRYQKLGGQSENKGNMYSAGVKYKF